MYKLDSIEIDIPEEFNSIMNGLFNKVEITDLLKIKR
jgi:hypothetical protein